MCGINKKNIRNSSPHFFYQNGVAPVQGNAVHLFSMIYCNKQLNTCKLPQLYHFSFDSYIIYHRWHHGTSNLMRTDLKSPSSTTMASEALQSMTRPSWYIISPTSIGSSSVSSGMLHWTWLDTLSPSRFVVVWFNDRCQSLIFFLYRCSLLEPLLMCSSTTPYFWRLTWSRGRSRRKQSWGSGLTLESSRSKYISLLLSSWSNLL